jgi:hypothetical protein
MKYFGLLLSLRWGQIFWLGLGLWYFYKNEHSAGIGCFLYARLLYNNNKSYNRYKVLEYYMNPPKLPWMK